ncbi:hypothetical protein HCJ93_08275 [Streptomyces sp. SBST2-5]|jgi:hypothetical protein|uniref:Uncharacterized protein n=1 Tax=Streptomyces composti TaxID=2720025 RepID=A0ABX1A4U2_9ACTN|nr:hypothetical protein [Streptomyces composti]NJP50067.1 hypothetical protein [Streptomyces composti]
MTDTHTGLPHDLPLAKVRIYKQGVWWYWEHPCVWRPASTPYNSYPCVSHATALQGALRHLERCA